MSDIIIEDNKIVINVKSNTYKAVKNYIHNEIGLDKPAFEKMIADYVGVYMEKGDLTVNIIERKVNEAIAKTIKYRYGGGVPYDKAMTFDERMNKKIDMCVDKIVAEAIDRQLREVIKEIAEGMIREKLSLE